MRMMPRLSKLDSKGKIRVWDMTIYTEYGQTPYYEISHGLEDGKKQIDKREFTQGKNIGRSNETTPAEQCVSEAESLWKKKQDSGYTCHDSNSLWSHPTKKAGLMLKMTRAKEYLPMLAKSFKDDGHKISYPCLGQPKLDGIRCLSYCYDQQQTILLSRKGKRFGMIPHIETAMEKLFAQPAATDRVFDGELFSKDLTFQQIASIVRKSKTQDPDFQKIEYHIYDTFVPGKKETFEERWDILKKLKFSKPLVKVDTNPIVAEYEVMTRLSVYEQDGYEGLMLRNASGVYEQNRRSENLQKVKSFIDAEFEIVGGKPGQGRFANFCTFVCKTKDGKEFEAMPMGTAQEREAYLRDLKKYIGKELTVRYFELTDDGIPRFPVGVIVRDFE